MEKECKHIKFEKR